MLKVVSHTPIECEKLTAVQKTGSWVDAMRMLAPEPEKLYTWWSYRATDNWQRRRPAAAGSITSGSRPRSPTASPSIKIAKDHARLDAAVRPRAGDGDAGSLS